MYLEGFQVCLLQPRKQDPVLISGLEGGRNSGSGCIEYEQVVLGHNQSESSLMVGQDAAPVRGFTVVLGPKTVNGMCQSWSCYFLLGL